MSDFMRSSRSPVAATPLLALATFLSLWSLSRMIILGDWTGTTALVLAIVVGAVMLTRLATRSRVVPTLVGAAVGLLLLLPFYVTSESGSRAFLPSPANFRGLGAVMSTALEYAGKAFPPAPVTNELACFLTAAIIGLFLAAEHVAVSWRAVASSGLILILPWLPAIILQHRISGSALLLAIGSWILAMALSRTNAPVERGISFGAGAAATTASIMLAMLAVPAALGGNGWGALPRFDTPPGFETSTRLNLALDLQSSLTTNSKSPQIVYLSSGARPDAFRLYTFTEFDGVEWLRADAPEEEATRPVGDTVLWPESVDGWVESDRVRIDIKILGLIERNLPIPAAPRTVEAPGNWTYDPQRDEVTAVEGSTQNLQYALVADLNYHDAKSLRAANATLATDPSSDETRAEYLDIAPAIDLDRVRSLTEKVTEDAGTRYDAAVAIQTYLRDPATFTYDTAVDPSGGDAVASFLENRKGFCLQFATTMVVMLRSIGIPARLAIGFLPGTVDGEGQYVIRGSDAHAWPEVYFPGEGWVRFEPTPSVQSGAPPIYADPFAGQVPVPNDVVDGGTGEPVPGGGAVDGGGENPGTVEAAGGLPWWLITILAILGAGAGFVVLLLWRRRGGHSLRHLHGPEGAWSRLRERLGDLAWPDSFTPAEARVHILTGLRRMAGRDAGPEPTAALDALTGVVSNRRYAPWVTEVTDAQLEAWVNAIVAEAEATTSETTVRPLRDASRSALRAGS